MFVRLFEPDNVGGLVPRQDLACSWDVLMVLDVGVVTRQIKLLQSQHAQLSLAARDEHGGRLRQSSCRSRKMTPPSPDLVASVLADLRNSFPRQDDFAEPPPSSTSAGAWSLLSLGGYSRKYQPPLPEEIERTTGITMPGLPRRKPISTRRPSGS